MIFCKLIKMFKGFRMHRSRGRNSSFGFLMILGASEWPEGAGEVDLYPGGSIWKGLDPPEESFFFKLLEGVTCSLGRIQ